MKTRADIMECAEKTLKERVRTSRLLGSDPSLVLHGGGNTSAKGRIVDIDGQTIDVIWVKGSGWDLATIEDAGFPALDLKKLRKLRAIDELSDEEMVRCVQRCMIDPSGPSPSIETLVHAFLPHVFIDHSHADAILAISNRVNGEALCQEIFGDRVVALPFIMPGFPLSKAVVDAVDAHPDVEGVFLHKHGLFTFGETGEESLHRHLELVNMASSYFKNEYRNVTEAIAQTSKVPSEVLPALRGTLGGQHILVLETRQDPWILAALARSDAEALLVTPPLTPDHTIRTKSLPCWIDPDKQSIASAIDRYIEAYNDYYTAGCAARGSRTPLDPSPRVMLVPGLGLVTAGATSKAARIAGDIAEHTILTKLAGAGLGAYEGLPDLDLFDMEYWTLEQAKISKQARRPLEGQVAVLTGGAGAIGEGIARVLADAGAAVALLDIRGDEAKVVADQIGIEGVTAVQVDVTDEESIRSAFEEICLRYGGVDILIPNAGVAHSAPLDQHDTDIFRHVVEINQIGVFLTLKVAIPILRNQGRGGSVVIVSSKNVLAPGAEFSSYSSSKAGAQQLGKVAAMELAGDDIHVNMVCPDAVFGTRENPSGLWNEVGPQRAASRGLATEDLEEFYRQRNLLKTTISAEDVGQAVLFFASRATPTTGALLPVDGGVPAGFPR